MAKVLLQKTEHVTIKLRKLNGKYRLQVKVYSFTRGGKDSPTAIYLWYRNRWISPLEMRLRWEPLSLFQLMLMTYLTPKITDLIMSENPFLKLIECSDEFTGSYIQVPLIYEKA